MSAKFAEAGGADLILIYNSGRFRMAGHGSNAGLLAIGDANAIVMEMGEREVLPVVTATPSSPGSTAPIPPGGLTLLRCRHRDGLRRRDQLPLSRDHRRPWRRSLELTGFGYDREVAMIAKRHARRVHDGLRLRRGERGDDDVGVDVVVAHMGLTVGGSIGAPTDFAIELDEAIGRIEAIASAAREQRPDVLVVCHGGPIATVADVEYVLGRSSAVGFIGASSVERLPVETALQATVARFKTIPLRR